MDSTIKILTNLTFSWSLQNVQDAFKTITSINDVSLKTNFYILISLANIPVLSNDIIKHFAIEYGHNEKDFPTFINLNHIDNFIQFLPLIIQKIPYFSYITSYIYKICHQGIYNDVICYIFRTKNLHCINQFLLLYKQKIKEENIVQELYQLDQEALDIVIMSLPDKMSIIRYILTHFDNKNILQKNKNILTKLLLFNDQNKINFNDNDLMNFAYLFIDGSLEIDSELFACFLSIANIVINTELFGSIEYTLNIFRKIFDGNKLSTLKQKFVFNEMNSFPTVLYYKIFVHLLNKDDYLRILLSLFFTKDQKKRDELYNILPLYDEFHPYLNIGSMLCFLSPNETTYTETGSEIKYLIHASEMYFPLNFCVKLFNMFSKHSSYIVKTLSEFSPELPFIKEILLVMNAFLEGAPIKEYNQTNLFVVLYAFSISSMNKNHAGRSFLKRIVKEYLDLEQVTQLPNNLPESCSQILSTKDKNQLLKEGNDFIPLSEAFIRTTFEEIIFNNNSLEKKDQIQGNSTSNTTDKNTGGGLFGWIGKKLRFIGSQDNTTKQTSPAQSPKEEKVTEPIKLPQIQQTQAKTQDSPTKTKLPDADENLENEKIYLMTTFPGQASRFAIPSSDNECDEESIKEDEHLLNEDAFLMSVDITPVRKVVKNKPKPSKFKGNSESDYSDD